MEELRRAVEEDPRSVAVAVVLGLVIIAVGLLVRGSGSGSRDAIGANEVESKHAAGFSSGRASVVQTGEVRCAVAGPGDPKGVDEAASDFLRNLRADGAILLATAAGVTPLVDACPALASLRQASSASASASGKAESDNDNDVGDATGALLVQLQAALAEHMLAAGAAAADVPAGLAALALQMVTVTPAMEALLHAGVMPPAMFQPLYTLAVSSDGLRCVTEGFVGAPVLGPPNPNLKYTGTRMRIVSEDLVAVARSFAAPEDDDDGTGEADGDEGGEGAEGAGGEEKKKGQGEEKGRDQEEVEGKGQPEKTPRKRGGERGVEGDKGVHVRYHVQGTELTTTREAAQRSERLLGFLCGTECEASTSDPAWSAYLMHSTAEPSTPRGSFSSKN